MPTDLTGTPTSLGIGTFNTSVDAPSGLGFNAAMAQIDALIAARVTNPAGKAAGDVPVWNGSAWVVPSGTRNGSKYLRDDGSWQAISSGPGAPVTSLPGSPTVGQQCILVDNTATPTYSWLMTYSTAASKWLFSGGSWLEGTTTVTVPIAGDYYVEIGAEGGGFGATNGPNLTITAGGITLFAGGGGNGGGTQNMFGSLYDKGKMTGLTASQVLTPTSANTPTRPYIRIQPVKF